MRNLRPAVLSSLAIAMLLAPLTAGAQSFTVDKYDLKGDGGTDYVAANHRPAACSCRARRT